MKKIFTFLALYSCIVLGIVFLNPIGNTEAIESEPVIDIETAPTNRLFDIKNIKPGDWAIRTLTIENKGNRNFEYNMRVEKESGSDLFYDTLLLEVSDDSSLLYKGKLSGFQGFKSRELAMFTSEDLTFRVDFPFESGNEYQGLETAVLFKFTAEAVGTQCPEGEDCSPIKVNPVCSEDPTETRVWVVKNNSDENIYINWELLGSQQGQAEILIPAGDEITLTTDTIEGPNQLKVTYGDGEEIIRDSNSEPCETPDPELTITELCTEDPSETRVWKVKNISEVDTYFTWNVIESNEASDGSIPIETGEEVLVTTAAVEGKNTLQIMFGNEIVRTLESNPEECNPPEEKPELTIEPLCSENPDETRVWKVTNVSDVDTRFSWSLLGSNQTSDGLIEIKAGEEKIITVSVGGDRVVPTVYQDDGMYTLEVIYGPDEKQLKSESTPETCPLPEEPELTIEPICSEDPSETRRWKIKNVSEIDTFFSWSIADSAQYSEGAIDLKAGEEYILTTRTEVELDNVLRIVYGTSEKTLTAESSTEQCELPELTIDTVCSKDPDETRVWKVKNISNVDTEFIWNLEGTNTYSDSIAIKAGETITLETDTVSGENVLVVTYLPKETIIKKSSTTEKCSTPKKPDKPKVIVDPICTNDPDETRAWKVRNTSNSELDITWTLLGTDQQSEEAITLQAGESIVVTTDTIDGKNRLEVKFKNGTVLSTNNGDTCTPPPPVETPIEVGTVCSPDPTETRKWIITNTSDEGTTITWEVVGTDQRSEEDITLKPGEQVTITTDTVDGQNRLRVNYPNGAVYENSSTEACSIPPQPKPSVLKVGTACSENPDETRVWIITNTSDKEVSFTWRIPGTDQQSTELITLAAGEQMTLTTETETNVLNQLEITSPSGVNIFDSSDEPCPVVPEEDGETEGAGEVVVEDEPAEDVVAIPDEALPQTGETNPAIFYSSGLVLMFIGVSILVARRRRARE
ncbi:LPXTG cell wall anchor domain-containing protein [Bacillus sp. HMF5848]|uniref:LPXTG cell wall anchor domain-containing protein n=1 Tax=Bacillus sp. HMF5848 TaxID=2495421 RepID=UPI000F79858C|nr:LPXTG cell wall anchor domain-containing protein [Bacillus sp. HMF5848]RSK26413.1 LPXTG cell wall anchor domain-containing protein [Bacillus sp. HMF5848]